MSKTKKKPPIQVIFQRNAHISQILKLPVLAKYRKNVYIGQFEQCISMNNSYVIQISVPAHHESVDVGAR